MDWHRRIRSELKIKSLPRGLKCSGNKLKQFLFKKRTHYRIRSKIRREKLIGFMYYFHNHNALKLNSKIKFVIVKANNCIIIIIFSNYKFFSKYLCYF